MSLAMAFIGIILRRGRLFAQVGVRIHEMLVQLRGHVGIEPSDAFHDIVAGHGAHGGRGGRCGGDAFINVVLTRIVVAFVEEGNCGFRIGKTGTRRSAVPLMRMRLVGLWIDVGRPACLRSRRSRNCPREADRTKIHRWPA